MTIQPDNNTNLIADDTKPIYERLDQEPSAWFAKYLLFRNMKPNRRSLLGAYAIYQQQAGKSPKKPYTDVPGAWKQAAEKYDWRFRAQQYDAMLHKEAEARAAALREFEAAEIERIMSEDYALKHKRIEALARMAHDIEKSFQDPETQEINYLWMSAKTASERIGQWRGCLEDIAKELGDRVQKKELTGKNGGAIEVEFTTDWGNGALVEDQE